MKYISKIAFAIILSLTFFACNEEDSLNSKENNLLTMVEIQQIGQKHNEALESVFAGLKKSNISFSKNKNNISDILNFELNNFYEDNFKSESEIEKANFYSEKEVSRYISKLGASSQKGSSDNSSPIEIIIQENSEYLSEDQINLLLQCDNVLKNVTKLSASIDELNSIQALAQSELSESEAQVILISTEIAKASLQYWNDNFDEWVELLSENGYQQKSSRWFSWSDVAGADVAGGVGAAVGAVTVNIIIGAGTVAYGGAIIGGAVAGSAASAVYQIWQNIF